MNPKVGLFLSLLLYQNCLILSQRPTPPPIPDPYACNRIECPLYSYCILVPPPTLTACICDVPVPGVYPPNCLNPNTIPTTAKPTTSIVPTTGYTSPPNVQSLNPLPPIYSDTEIVYLLFSGLAPTNQMMLNLVSYYLYLPSPIRIGIANISYSFNNDTLHSVNTSLVTVDIFPPFPNTTLITPEDSSDVSSRILAYTLVYLANLKDSYLRESFPTLIKGFMDESVDPVEDFRGPARDYYVFLAIFILVGLILIGCTITFFLRRRKANEALKQFENDFGKRDFFYEKDDDHNDPNNIRGDQTPLFVQNSDKTKYQPLLSDPLSLSDTKENHSPSSESRIGMEYDHEDSNSYNNGVYHHQSNLTSSTPYLSLN